MCSLCSRDKRRKERALKSVKEETRALFFSLSLSLSSFREDFFEKKNDTLEYLRGKETEDGREKSSDASRNEEDENALSFDSYCQRRE